MVDLESLVLDAGEDDDEGELMHLPLVLREQPLDTESPKSLYFRVPPNRELLDYWDKVESRLRNIRLSRTIDGAFAPMPLTAAQIPPEALADAAALGLSPADAIAMAAAAPPPYRFRTMFSKAQEHCNEVKALGAALLTALEKRDGEQLAAVRSGFEKPILSANRAIKLEQRRQAEKEVVALEHAKEVVRDREQFFSKRKFMNDLEKAAFLLNGAAGVLDATSGVLQLASGGAALIPDGTVGVAGLSGSPLATVKVPGGEKVSDSMSKWAQAFGIAGRLADRSAAMVSTHAGYERRYEDWKHQARQASLEEQHIDVQITAAVLRLAVIDAELRGQDASDNAWRQADRLLREKFTNQTLYDWYATRLVEVFRRAYEQALQLASLARECFVFETGQRDAARAPAGAWDRLKSGLLAGEGLSRYLCDLEIAYLKDPLYDRIVTTHISLRQAVPLAFLTLIEKGSTGTFTLDKWWFKRLYPGITRRRIRALSVSIPCVTGPYVSVNATLKYEGSSPTVVKAISLSTGNTDYGWDLSNRTERYMPFEGVSLDTDTTWSLTFTETDVDVTTIADVVLHVEYAADEGADGAPSPQEFKLFIDVARTVPDAWNRLLTAEDHACSFEVAELLPSFLREFDVTRVDTLVVMDADRTRHDGKLNHEVKEPQEAGKSTQIEIRANPGDGVPWGMLRHAFLVATVSK